MQRQWCSTTAELADTGEVPQGPRFRLGLVGLAGLGLPIARRLLAKGWRLTVWDDDPERFDPLRETQARWAGTPGEVRAGSDVVLVCLPGEEAVEAACFGQGGLVGTKGAHIVIDLSTTGVELTRRAAEALDVAWLDSPVSGGPEAAGTGEATLMVGGTEELFDWVRPVLADISSNTTLMGPLGAGQTAMMIGNALVGATYVLVAEVVRQARAAGIDGEKLLGSLRGGPGDSAVLAGALPRMLKRDFNPAQVSVAQMHAALQAVRAFNEARDLTLPVEDVAIDQFRHLAEEGDGALDCAAVVTIYEPGQ